MKSYFFYIFLFSQFFKPSWKLGFRFKLYLKTFYGILLFLKNFIFKMLSRLPFLESNSSFVIFTCSWKSIFVRSFASVQSQLPSLTLAQSRNNNHCSVISLFFLETVKSKEFWKWNFRDTERFHRGVAFWTNLENKSMFS